MLKTTVYLTPALKARLETAARTRGQSEADVIRAAIASFTAGERPRPRLALTPGLGVPIDLAERVDEVLSEGFGRV